VDKGKINFLIDALMFLCMAALAGIGFLMKYVLLPGREVWAVYGKKVDLSWLGLDRHAWGAVHLYLAFLLLGLLLLHIILHWQMIIGLFHKFIAPTNLGDEVAIVFVILCVALLFFPFFINPEIDDSPPGKGRDRGGIEQREDVGPEHAGLTDATVFYHL
jgi:Domain of unknown function (DUF4405)